MNTNDIRQLSPLKLAFVGDAVFEQYIRRYLVESLDLNTHDLARFATRFVKAGAQCRILMHTMPMLTEEELDIVRRGRNQKPKTVPKNADVADYRHATGYEALIGRLFLAGEFRRLEELIDCAIRYVMGGEDERSSRKTGRPGDDDVRDRDSAAGETGEPKE